MKPSDHHNPEGALNSKIAIVVGAFECTDFPIMISIDIFDNVHY